MKKLAWLSMLVFIPLGGGLAMVGIGSATGNEQVLKIGSALASFGTPVTMFALVVIGLILMIITDDREFNAYTRTFYEIGDEVTFAVLSKRRASIIEE